MKIVVMGAGAMGSLFGGLLGLSKEEIWLVDIREEQIDAIRSVGLIVEAKGKEQMIRVNATSDVTSIGKADLVIFFVKTYHTEKAISDALVLRKEDTIFLTLQNGLGNEEAICKKIGQKNVMLGVNKPWGKISITEERPKSTPSMEPWCERLSVWESRFPIIK